MQGLRPIERSQQAITQAARDSETAESFAPKMRRPGNAGAGTASRDSPRAGLRDLRHGRKPLP